MPITRRFEDSKNYIKFRGQYLVCPNNNRVFDPSDVPVGPAMPFRLKKTSRFPRDINRHRYHPGNRELFKSIFDSPLLVEYDSWIAIAKEDVRDTNIVIKEFLRKDIKPSTSYLIREKEMWDGNAVLDKVNINNTNTFQYNWYEPEDYITYVNSQGTQLTLRFDNRHPFHYNIVALDRNGKKIQTQSINSYRMEINEESLGPVSQIITCNTDDSNITYKGVYTFKMVLYNEYGERYMSPLMILNTKFIMKTQPALESGGEFQF